MKPVPFSDIQIASDPPWDSTAVYQWPAPFEEVEIPSTLDGTPQKAYIYQTTAGQPMPLVISLHTWSGDYKQRDELSELVQKENWNLIHPDFRGPNRTAQSCGSKFVIQDIDDAIGYAIENMPVDKSHIFVVGVSGGGHAACLSYLTTQYPVNTIFAWASVTDIEAWYYQSRNRKSRYADDIFSVTRSANNQLNVKDARSRSPMWLPLPKDSKSTIHLFAGIHDGYTGSVPISQSLLFYNRLAAAGGDTNALVPESDIIALVARGKLTGPDPGTEIGGRKVFLHKESILASITLFEGTHEMLAPYCMGQMEEIVSGKRL